MKRLLPLAFLPLVASAANPYLPLWEYIPDGEPYVFEDPDKPGEERVYLYGSHDTMRFSYCGRDQVVWSASVNDLNHWRCEGVAFTSLLDRDGGFLNADRRADVLFAPDVTVTTDAEGKKTYWLFPNVQAGGRNGIVAKSDRPAGPYVVANWSATDPKKAGESLFGFDPSVFVDDDGRIYGYWGFESSNGAEVDPKTMCTVKPGTKVVRDMISSSKQPGVFRFFEASSMRKIKDKYVFVYSRKTMDGEFGLPSSNYTLAYAYGDKPLGPFTYGGTIIDGRGRETRPDGTTIHTAAPNGNTHGGLCQIKGQWYVFYHRQSSDNDYSRQAMVAPITIDVEEGPGGKVTISEGEYTSEGFELGGLDPFERHLAGIACHYTGPTPSYAQYPNCIYSGPYVKPHVGDFYKERDPYGTKHNRSVITHVTPGSTLGYKYFDFDRFAGANDADLVLTVVPQGRAGRLTVWVKRPTAAEGGVKLGETEVEQVRVGVARRVRVQLSGLKAVTGKAALYFTFTAEEDEGVICEIEDFIFERADAASRVPPKPDATPVVGFFQPAGDIARASRPLEGDVKVTVDALRPVDLKGLRGDELEVRVDLRVVRHDGKTGKDSLKFFRNGRLRLVDTNGRQVFESPASPVQRGVADAERVAGDWMTCAFALDTMAATDGKLSTFIVFDHNDIPKATSDKTGATLEVRRARIVRKSN